MLTDCFLIVLSLLASFSIRLGNIYFPSNDLFWAIFAAPVLAIPIFFSFNLYHSLVRYMGPKTLIFISHSVTIYSLSWGLIAYMASLQGIPRSVIIINWMLCFLLISGSRLLARELFLKNDNPQDKRKKNILIYGSGSSGRQLSAAMSNSNDYSLVGYIDDDPKLQQNFINGIQVYSFSKVPFLIKNYNVSEVLLALPSISRTRRKAIIENLNPLPISVKSIPTIKELAGGALKIDDLLEINIADLLGRDSVKANKVLMQTKIYDKSVMVTGAGGSIGSELCRQIILLKPKTIILYEISEASLYLIEQELLSLKISGVQIHPILGSVKSKEHFQNVCVTYKIQTIYHTAAYKHVPLVEFNQSEGVLNNVIGTMIAAQVALATKVETFVLISTDKAVRPTNIMGASKRAAELVLQALSKMPGFTCFTMVRFGNVLDSSGSVIPLFKKQIRHGGPITVTDKNVVRYFMTIPESVELVIQAGSMAKGGDVFVLDMGEPIHIYDLAIKMIQLSGLEVLDASNPNGDIEIKFTGLRPGEKLFEELLVDANAISTENELIMRAEEKMISWNELEPVLFKINKAALNSDDQKVRELLVQIVPEFSPQS